MNMKELMENVTDDGLVFKTNLSRDFQIINDGLNVIEEEDDLITDEKQLANIRNKANMEILLERKKFEKSNPYHNMDINRQGVDI